LLWNRVENARLERDAPAPALQQVKERFARAHAARRAAAEAVAQARHTGQPPDEAAYLARVAEVEAVRKDAVALLRTVNGDKPYNDTNYIFMTYVLGNLPRGLAGLVVAVIFAAAMSTLSGEFNSLATATMVDFHKRYFDRGGTDAHDLLMSRLFTAFWGGCACLIALRAGQLGSVIVVVNQIGSLFYGSILGVFGLAVLTRRATAPGAFFGLLIGMATVSLVSAFTQVHFLWWNVVGALTVFVAGYLISLLSPPEETGA
jgi:Na+/proline symporter